MEQGRRLGRLDTVMKTISKLMRNNFRSLAVSAAPTADRLCSQPCSAGFTLQTHNVADDFLRRVFACIALQLSAEIATVCTKLVVLLQLLRRYRVFLLFCRSVRVCPKQRYSTADVATLSPGNVHVSATRSNSSYVCHPAIGNCINVLQQALSLLLTEEACCRREALRGMHHLHWQGRTAWLHQRPLSVGSPSLPSLASSLCGPLLLAPALHSKLLLHAPPLTQLHNLCCHLISPVRSLPICAVLKVSSASCLIPRLRSAPTPSLSVTRSKVAALVLPLYSASPAPHLQKRLRAASCHLCTPLAPAEPNLQRCLDKKPV